MTYNRRSTRKSDYEPSKTVTAKIRRAVEERQARDLAHLIQSKHNWTCYCDYCLGHLKPKKTRSWKIMAWGDGQRRVPMRSFARGGNPPKQLNVKAIVIG